MSLKIQIRNLNLKSVDKNYCQQIDFPVSNSNVDDLIKQISAQLNVDSSQIDLLYKGQILKRNEHFEKIIQQDNEADVYVFKRAQVSHLYKQPTNTEINSMINHLNSLFRSKTRRNYLENLLRNIRKLDVVLNARPEIKNDKITYGIVQNYEMIKFFTDLKRCESVIEKNPNIYYALKLLIDHTRENAKKAQTNEKFITKRSYMIDDMSEDEEQQSHRATSASTSSNVQRQGPAITQNHLSAVLSMLNQQASSAQNQPVQSANLDAANNLQAGDQQAQAQEQPQPTSIDRNYFQNVMQQIMNQQSPNSRQPAAPVQSPTAQNQTPRNEASSELAEKLEQMHELGFLDDSLNVRALQITEGNVDAAVNLLLEGGDLI